MTPTIGRVVEYTLTSYDAEAINRRRADAGQSGIIAERSGAQVHFGNQVDAGQQYPMVITRVWMPGQPLGGVNGQVLLDGNDTFWACSVAGHAESNPIQGRWREFPRVGA